MSTNANQTDKSQFQAPTEVIKRSRRIVQIMTSIVFQISSVNII
jgi:hypothetical protein